MNHLRPPVQVPPTFAAAVQCSGRKDVSTALALVEDVDAGGQANGEPKCVLPSGKLT